MFVQKYEKFFFDFYGGENFFVKAWKRSLRSLVKMIIAITL